MYILIAFHDDKPMTVWPCFTDHQKEMAEKEITAAGLAYASYEYEDDQPFENGRRMFWAVTGIPEDSMSVERQKEKPKRQYFTLNKSEMEIADRIAAMQFVELITEYRNLKHYALCENNEEAAIKAYNLALDFIKERQKLISQCGECHFNLEVK